MAKSNDPKSKANLDIAKYGQGLISGLTTEKQTLVPRHKFQFDLKINYGVNGELNTKETVSGKNLRIASVDLPAHSFNVATFNSYNRKRLVQSGVTYSPITLVVYDTVDGTMERFLEDYSNYYYGDGTMIVDDIKAFNSSFTSPSSEKTPPGFKAPEGPRYFITNFEIERSTDGGTDNPVDISTHTLYNPLITNINTDKLAYADSGLIEYQIQLNYEGYNVDREIDFEIGKNGDYHKFFEQYESTPFQFGSGASSSVDYDQERFGESTLKRQSLGPGAARSDNFAKDAPSSTTPTDPEGTPMIFNGSEWVDQDSSDHTII